MMVEETEPRARISVMVPTYARPEHLRRCLVALGRQTRRAAEVVVSYREDDEESRLAVEQFAALLPGVLVGVVVPAGANLVASMNAGLRRTTGDWVAMTDDDAEPGEDWLERLASYFDDPSIAGIGGRDRQVQHPGEAAVVGKLQWFGRLIGNHHLGVGPPRDVDVLKGVNCCFRGDLLRAIGFDRRLRGVGNVANWEVALCLTIRSLAQRLVYDPSIVVQHHVAPRMDGDVNHRGGFAAGPLRDAVHNETLAVLEHVGAVRAFALIVWSIVVGGGQAPGIAQILRWTVKCRSLWQAGHRVLITVAGRSSGVRTHHHSHRSTVHQIGATGCPDLHNSTS